MIEKIYVIGSGGHARVVVDAIESIPGRWRIIGIWDMFKSKDEKVFDKYKIVHDIPDGSNAIVAIGDNSIRFKESQKPLNFVNIIHPSAVISYRAEIGVGNVFMAGTVINTGTKIGNHCVINTGSTLDHDNIMEDFSSVAPGVTAGGNVKIGKYSAICLGAKIAHNCEIGENTIIGLNSGVIKSLPPNILAYGTPCKKIKDRKFGDQYL